jgi:predicted transcriptional regulator
MNRYIYLFIVYLLYVRTYGCFYILILGLHNVLIYGRIDAYRYRFIYSMHIDNGMKYRDRNEIIAQILETANGNRVRLTKIMYDVFLSHTLTKEYVRLLIEKGLIEYLDGERTFKTTDKGMNFLRIHNRVQELSPLTTKL